MLFQFVFLEIFQSKKGGPFPDRPVCANECEPGIRIHYTTDGPKQRSSVRAARAVQHVLSV